MNSQKEEIDRLEKQFSFIKEIDKEKKITRQTYISSGERMENDAEHAWHMAIMTLLLSEYANENIDILKTISMLLIHDLVEIDAGDTYAYDEAGKASQRQREEQAAERIFGLLPQDQGKKMRALWDEFEKGENSGSKVCPCYGQHSAGYAQRRDRRKSLGRAEHPFIPNPQTKPGNCRRLGHFMELRLSSFHHAQCGEGADQRMIALITIYMKIL